MNKKVRFGIIGCGGISYYHAEAIICADDAEMTCVYDTYTPNIEKFVEKYSSVRVCASVDEMVNSSDVDAVVICTPSGLHTEQAITAMQKGKHVVVEKPMSLTLSDADRLIITAEETKTKVCVISQLRYSPAVQEMKRAIDIGALGRIVAGSLSMKYFRTHEYYEAGGWRGTWEMDGGGALMNQGIHGIDMFRYLMGPVDSLYGFARTQTRRIEVEDSGVALLEFKNGALGTIEGYTTCYPGYARRIEICGDQGSMVLEEDSIIKWDLPIEARVPVGIATESEGASIPMAISYEGHIRQIANFVDAILRDAPLMADAASGRPPLEIILGIYESSKTGQRIFF